MTNLELLNSIYGEYKDSFEGAFHTTLWEILMKGRFPDVSKIAFTPILQPDSSYMLAIAEEDEAGYLPTMAFFKNETRKDCAQLALELNKKISGNSYEQSIAIWLSTMKGQMR